MNFHIELRSGTDVIEVMPSFVHDTNDFRTASMMATAALFTNKDADNVTCFRVLPSGAVSDDNFFYAEKG